METMSAACINSKDKRKAWKEETGPAQSQTQQEPVGAIGSHVTPLPAHFIQERLVLFQEGEIGGTLLPSRHTNKSRRCDHARETKKKEGESI